MLIMLKPPSQACWVLLASCLLPLQAVADTHTLTATGEHQLGKYDTLPEAQRLAAATAKAAVLEQAATYLETVSGVNDLGLNRDELRAYIVGLFEIRLYPGQMSEAVGTTTVSAPVSVVLDPAVVTHQIDSLMQNERAKTELMRIRDKLNAYRKELGTGQQRLATITNTSDAKLIREHRRDVLDLIDSEEQLAHTWTSVLGILEAKHPPGGVRHKSDALKHEPPGTPDNGEEHRKKGVRLTQQARYDDALAEFRQALRLMPDLDRAHLGLGAALQGKGDLDGAITEYRTFLQRHVDDPDGHNNLGSVLQRKGELAAAIAEYRTALQARPDNALTHFNLGTALATQGQVEAAATEYRTAIRLNPDLVEAYFDLGGLLKATNQPREAADMFQEYVKRAPATPANKPWIDQATAFLEKRWEKQRETGGPQGSGL